MQVRHANARHKLSRGASPAGWLHIAEPTVALPRGNEPTDGLHRPRARAQLHRREDGRLQLLYNPQLPHTV